MPFPVRTVFSHDFQHIKHSMLKEFYVLVFAGSNNNNNKDFKHAPPTTKTKGQNISLGIIRHHRHHHHHRTPEIDPEWKDWLRTSKVAESPCLPMSALLSGMQ